MIDRNGWFKSTRDACDLQIPIFWQRNWTTRSLSESLKSIAAKSEGSEMNETNQQRPISGHNDSAIEALADTLLHHIREEERVPRFETAEIARHRNQRRRRISRLRSVILLQSQPC